MCIWCLIVLFFFRFTLGFYVCNLWCFSTLSWGIYDFLMVTHTPPPPLKMFIFKRFWQYNYQFLVPLSWWYEGIYLKLILIFIFYCNDILLVTLRYFPDLVFMLLLVRSPGSMPCPNYEVVGFQPLEQWTIHTLDSGCPARIL